MAADTPSRPAVRVETGPFVPHVVPAAPRAPEAPGPPRPFLFALAVVVGAAAAALLAFWPGPAEDALSDDELHALIAEPPPAATVTEPAARAAMTLTSDEPGAAVWLDDALAGETPMTLSELRPGLHTLRVVHAGEALLDTLLFVGRGAALELHVAAPTPAPPLMAAERPARRTAPRTGAPSVPQSVDKPRVGWRAPDEPVALAGGRRVGW